MNGQRKEKTVIYMTRSMSAALHARMKVLAARKRKTVERTHDEIVEAGLLVLEAKNEAEEMAG